MRELTHEVTEFTQEELALMASSGVTGDEVREFIRTSGPQTLEAAIGGIDVIRKEQGQERNEPFAPQPAVEGATETGGVASHALGELAGEVAVVEEASTGVAEAEASL